ncbi:ionotropic receptor 93a isoform X2 [Hermetia illucens]|uniref:ionotropic receptor 93a isoform X2 n=1 Tax=Hermetia illucens TaxID=343691 RepID=UPI0018CC6C9C|nr:ionotropic receptor 93a isoform X2 [Hermetia illucens]
MAGIELILAAICLNSTCLTDTSLSTTATSFISNETSSLAEKERNLANLRNALNANGTVIGKGVSFDIVDFLAEKFNFTYDVVVPDKNIIGSSTDLSGSLIEILRNQSADIAAAFVPHLADLRQYIWFSTTLDEGEWTMVMLRPAESATGSGLLAPFETAVWILIIVSLFAVGPIIYGLIILRNKLTGDDSQKPYSLSHCAWFVYGALMKQGSTLSPIADSTRLLFATWWIFITILTSFYTANLTAFLTLSKFTLPFNSVDDIARREKHFVAQRGGGIEYAIKNDGELLNILSKMVAKNRAYFTMGLNDTETLMDYVEKKNYVFVRDMPAMKHMLYLDYRYRKQISMTDEKIHCPFAVSKVPFMRKKRSFLYPLQSKWSPLFEPEILNLVESGIVKFLIGKNLPKAEICPQDLAGTERQLRNGDLMMTYYIMLAGFVTAIVVFGSELIFRIVNERVAAKRTLTIGNFETRKDKSKKIVMGKDVTPPPTYNSLFFRHGKQATDFNVSQSQHNFEDSFHGKRRIINGRDYMVYEGNTGEKRLVPMRVPSATLFQYSYTE